MELNYYKDNPLILETASLPENEGFITLFQQILANGITISSWGKDASSYSSTKCVVIKNDYWIIQEGIGAIQFNETNRTILAYPDTSVDLEWFQFWVKHCWVPLAYQIWGFQVLHASAVVNTSSGNVCVFVGDNEAGKSTIAYGLGQRNGWQQIYDDTFSFAIDKGMVKIHFVPNVVRLRSESAKYYNQQTYSHQPIEWPDIQMKLKHIYILEKLDVPGNIKVKKFVEAYHNLLENAYTLTLNLPKHNKRLMSDYLTLASDVPVFGLSTSKNFDGIEEVLDGIKNHPI